MKITVGKSKQPIKASNEGRSDLIYVIMVNGDPVAKGSYDAMVKKSYTYNYPTQMLKFPKAKLNSLMKMAKDAHRPDPLKFAVNRFINDYTDEYDSLNASCTKKSVKASRRAVKAATDKNITYHRSGGTYYFTTYEVYADGTWVGKLEDHDRDVKQEYFVAWVTKNGISEPWKGDWESKFFYSEDEAIDWILSFQTAPIESGCTKKSVKSNKRRAIKASDFEFIMDEPEVDEEDDSLACYYSWDELTDAQREYVVSHWGDFRSFADAMYEWFNDYIMDMYYEDKEMLADEYNEKYGFDIDTDKISWSSSSQGPYPDHWDNEKIFGKVWLATAGNLSDVDVSFGGIYDVDTYADYYVGVGDDEHIEYGVGVDELADYGADEEAISIIRNLADGAQEFVDKVWELINYTCTAYPDDEWISETLDGNPNSFTFIVDDNGDVEDIN